MLGVQEHDHPAVAGRDLGGRPVLVGAVHVQHVVLHRGDRAGGGVDGVDDRVGEVAADQEVDVAVQGGGEQHPLALGADLVQERGDLGHEAHVGHLVGLVQDGDRDLVQPAVTAVDEVLEPARRRDDDLGATAQRVGLPADRHSADDGGQAQLHRAGVGGEGVGHLLGQLTRRHEDQGQRLAGLGALSGGAGQQGQAEGEGLAGAGAPASQGVAAREGVGQGRALDRERDAHALRGQRGQQLGGHVEVGERLDGGQRGSDRLRQGELALDRGGPPPVAARAARTAGTGSGRGRAEAAAPARTGAGPESGAAGAARAREERSFVRVGFIREPSLIRHVSRNSRSGRAARGITRTGRMECEKRIWPAVNPVRDAGDEMGDAMRT